ncbi:Lipoprotein signal peptidase [anaerobic digester metagenome]
MIWIIIILGIAGDYLSKRWALANLTAGQVIDLIPGYLNFSYVENRGAAFGIFQGQIRVLGVISLVMGTLLLLYLVKNRSVHPLIKISLSLIVAGALGNAYDRFFYGFVVDFIHFHLNSTWHFPTFNVADSCVVVGSGLMILYVLFIEGRQGDRS